MTAFHPLPAYLTKTERQKPTSCGHAGCEIAYLMTVYALMLLASASISAGCDLAGIKSARATHDALSHRAIEIISLAADATGQSDDRLATLIEPAAVFVLGAGDVGRPLGSGLQGVKGLAQAMRARSFRFYKLDYMDGPADACGELSVAIEFGNQAGTSVSSVEFFFRHGRLTGAKGWERSFQSGMLPPPSSKTDVR